MSRLRTVACACAALVPLLWTPAAQAKLQVSTTPDPVILGRGQPVQITVKGLPGQGELLGDANVGTVERVVSRGDTATVTYRPPRESFPQMLCLLLWRDGEIDVPVHVVRVPLFGPTTIPVKTRVGASIKVQVGGQEYGPVKAGSTGRAQIELAVPPGVRMAQVEVIDNLGLKTNRRVAIGQPPFNQLAMAITPRIVSGAGVPRFRLALAVADPDRVSGAPVAEVGQERVLLQAKGDGLWIGEWAPAVRPPQGYIALQVHLSGDEESQRQAEIGITAGELTVRVRHVRADGPRGAAGGLHGTIGVALGMTHNLGDLIAPRFGVEIGVEYETSRGLVGLRVHTGYGWATQRIASGAGLADAESTVMLIPLGGGLTYRAPLPYVTPYVYWGCMAQIVRSSNRAPYLTTDRARTDVVFGVMGLLGASARMGPGRLFLQLGYQWSRVENADVELLAGGLVLEGGYRLEL